MDFHHSNREPARIPPVRARRQHLLALRGQCPFGALFHHQPQRDEFVADRVGGELGAAVRQAFERRTLRLAEDDEFLFFGHLVGLDLLGSRRRQALVPSPLRLRSKLLSLATPPAGGRGWRGITPRRCPPLRTYPRRRFRR